MKFDPRTRQELSRQSLLLLSQPARHCVALPSTPNHAHHCSLSILCCTRANEGFLNYFLFHNTTLAQHNSLESRALPLLLPVGASRQQLTHYIHVAASPNSPAPSQIIIELRAPPT
jgi:hypothetical protein